MFQNVFNKLDVFFYLFIHYARDNSAASNRVFTVSVDQGAAKRFLASEFPLGRGSKFVSPKIL